MRNVDAHVHLWSSGTPIAHHRQVPAFPAEELLAESAWIGWNIGFD